MKPVFCRKPGRWVIGAFVVLLAASAAATTFRSEKRKYPVCGGEVTVRLIMSTNTFGGADRDFLRRARGDQPILLSAATCRSCLYFGYPDDFDDGAKVDAKVKEQVLAKALKLPAGAGADKISAWASYDLIAQVQALTGAKAESVAHTWHCASWAVRLGREPLAALDEAMLEKLHYWIRAEQGKLGDDIKQRQNSSDAEIAAARLWDQTARTSDGDARQMAGLAAFALLARHGENTEAARVLELVKPTLNAALFTKLSSAFTESVRLERDYQDKALGQFIACIRDEEDAEHKGVLTYLCGELCRRMERWDAARSHFDAAGKIEGRPEWLDAWIKEQAALLPPK